MGVIGDGAIKKTPAWYRGFQEVKMNTKRSDSKILNLGTNVK